MSDQGRRWLRAGAALAVVTVGGYLVAFSATRLPGDDTAPFVGSMGRAGDVIRQLVLLAVALAFVVIFRQTGQGLRARGPMQRRPSLLHTLLAVLVVAIVFSFLSLDDADPGATTTTATIQPPTEGTVATDTSSELRTRAPGWTLWLAAVGGLLAIAYLMWSRAATAPRKGTDRRDVDEEHRRRHFFEDPDDPRRRVIVAYLRVEEHSESVGMARSSSETVRSHLGRVGHGRRAVERLAAAYDRARFDDDYPDAGLADEAESAGREIGEGLR